MHLSYHLAQGTSSGSLSRSRNSWHCPIYSMPDCCSGQVLCSCRKPRDKSWLHNLWHFQIFNLVPSLYYVDTMPLDHCCAAVIIILITHRIHKLYNCLGKILNCARKTGRELKHRRTQSTGFQLVLFCESKEYIRYFNIAKQGAIANNLCTRYWRKISRPCLH